MRSELNVAECELAAMGVPLSAVAKTEGEA